MRIKIVLTNENIDGKQKTIWQIIPENSFELDLLEYISRKFETDIANQDDVILTVLNSEIIYHTSFIKSNFKNPDFQYHFISDYINEKGGVFDIAPIVKSFEKIKDFIEIPGKSSGITFSKKHLSEFFNY